MNLSFKILSNFHLFDFLPLWIIFFCLIGFIMLSAWSGVVFVRSRKESRKKSTELGHLGAIVGAMLGLVALILAFTFNITLTRFDARKHYLLQEVNAIETTWLRAGLISEPRSSEVKDLLLEFVRLRVATGKQTEKILEVIPQSNKIEKKIWFHVNELSKNEPRNDIFNALFIEAVNEMFDDQTKRLTATLSYRIPTLIWISFFMLILISMFGVGLVFGEKKETPWQIILVLALALGIVIATIIDLDSTSGIVQINYAPIFDLYQRLLNE